MSEQNKTLVKRWLEEVWNEGRESTIDELFHPEGKSHGFPEPDSVLIGPPGFKAIHRAFHTSYGTSTSTSMRSSPKETLSPSAGTAP